MSLSDQEKLTAARVAIAMKMDSYKEWSDFKVMLQGLTKQKFINFIKNSIEADATGLRNGVAHQTQRADDLDDISTELGNL
jgi:hypothetical protein